MKYAADFRSIARKTLYGKWKLVILVGVIALFLGGTSAEGFKLELEVEDTWAKAAVEFAGITVGTFGGGKSSVLGGFLLEHAKTIALFSVVVSIFSLIVGCIIEIGYKRFHLNLIDSKEASLRDLFQYFYNWKTVFIANLLQLIYIVIGLLLLIVPGIIAIYNYSMTSYILAEYPEIAASEAMKKSEEIMAGNRWRLFCLQVSFIGWEFLCAFTFGIGQLWLIPYKETAIAAFYREISGTWDEPEDYTLEETSKQRSGMIAVFLTFTLIAAASVLFIIGSQDLQETKKEEIVTKQIIHGNSYTVHHVIDGDIFSNEFWNDVTKIEYYDGTEYPYVVTDKEALQKIALLIKDLEHKKLEEKPMLEGGWFFDIYTEGAMSSIWVSNNVIDFNGINYKVPTEKLGDDIRALIMNSYEMSIRVDEYVVNDYRINILDKSADSDLLVDLEIQFLTDKEKQVLHNTVNVANQGTGGFAVKITDETEQTKVVNVIADGYELIFKFDVNTCEVFDIRKITE